MIDNELKKYDNIAQTFMNSLSDKVFEVIAQDFLNRIQKVLPLVMLCNRDVDYSKFLRYEGDNIIFDTSHLKSILGEMMGEDNCKIKWFGDVMVDGQDALQEIDDRIMLILYAEKTLKWKWDNGYHTADGKVATPEELLGIYQNL